MFFIWKFYYGCPPDERISFNITSAVPLLSMILIGYPLSYIWPRSKDAKSIEGLTLATYGKRAVEDNEI